MKTILIKLPIIAITRGIHPEEVMTLGGILVEVGFQVVETPSGMGYSLYLKSFGCSILFVAIIGVSRRKRSSANYHAIYEIINFKKRNKLSAKNRGARD